jgi:hypothetical protein
MKVLSLALPFSIGRRIFGVLQRTSINCPHSASGEVFKMTSQPFRVLICVVLLFAVGPYCRGQFVPNNVLDRTLMIQATKEGTAFTIEVDGRQYLITAKHVVSALPENAETMIKIRKKSGWSDLKIRIFKCDDPVDIAVLVPESQLTASYSLEPSSKGMIDGQNAYFVGFPYHSAVVYKSLPGVMPFIRRATVSAVQSFPEKGYQEFFLDGVNNPGFSGAPVVYRDLYRKNEVVFKVAAIITEFVPDAVPVLKKKKELRPEEVTPEARKQGNIVQMLDNQKFFLVEKTDQLVNLNTGLAKAWDIGTAVTLIQKHPIGPKVDDNFRAGSN